jgi:hypothetical protein
VVDGSKLQALTAEQINNGNVTNIEFDQLAGLRSVANDDGPGGTIQIQLDGKAQNGENSDITSITGLTTMLDVNQGGTGANNEADARVNLGLEIGVDVQAQNEHLEDLAEDGILSASKVEHGEYFIDEPGDPGFVWTSDGSDKGGWVDGGDISRVYTEENRGLFIGGDGSYEVTELDVLITVDAGTDINQIVQLQAEPGVVGGALPGVDGSQLTGLVAEQINADSDRPVSNEQFDLLTDLRTENIEGLPGGPLQDQLDRKQKQSDVLDDIVDATVDPENNPLAAANDLLIYKSEEGSWDLLK